MFSECSPDCRFALFLFSIFTFVLFSRSHDTHSLQPKRHAIRVNLPVRVCVCVCAFDYTHVHTHAWGTLTHTLAKRGPAHVEAKRDSTTTKRLKAKQIENLTTTTSQLFVASLPTLASTAAPVVTATTTALGCNSCQRLLLWLAQRIHEPAAPIAALGAGSFPLGCTRLAAGQSGRGTGRRTDRHDTTRRSRSCRSARLCLTCCRADCRRRRWFKIDASRGVCLIWIVVERAITQRGGRGGVVLRIRT